MYVNTYFVLLIYYIINLKKLAHNYDRYTFCVSVHVYILVSESPLI